MLWVTPVGWPGRRGISLLEIKSCFEVSLNQAAFPHGQLIARSVTGLDISGLDESRGALTLALHEAHKLGLCHAYRLAPMLGNEIHVELLLNLFLSPIFRPPPE
jgi:hypothetical protein